MRVYIGIDPRQPVAFNVLQWSITRRTSRPLAIVPLVLPTLPITRTGLTDFTYSRYLVPALSGFQGISVFLDADMLLQADINELETLINPNDAVSVVKSANRFEWPSMMVFNNEKCKTLTADYINDENNHPSDFSWAGSVGELPSEWNFTVGYDKPIEQPKLIHYTAGIPHFPETKDCDYAEAWTKEFDSMVGNCSWLELMGDSVHAELVLNNITERRKAWQSRHTVN